MVCSQNMQPSSRIPNWTYVSSLMSKVWVHPHLCNVHRHHIIYGHSHDFGLKIGPWCLILIQPHVKLCRWNQSTTLLRGAWILETSNLPRGPARGGASAGNPVTSRFVCLFVRLLQTSRMRGWLTSIVEMLIGDWSIRNRDRDPGSRRCRMNWSRGCSERSPQANEDANGWHTVKLISVYLSDRKIRLNSKKIQQNHGEFPIKMQDVYLLANDVTMVHTGIVAAVCLLQPRYAPRYLIVVAK